MLKGVKKQSLSLAVCLLLLIVAVAGFSSSALADNIVQSFNSKDKLEAGIIVALDSDSSSAVVANPGSRADLIFGITVDKSTAPLYLQKGDSSTYIANQGEYPVIVSDENGPINSGDYVSVSSSAGIGAKAGDNQSVVIGQAIDAFNGQVNTIGQSQGHNLGKINLTVYVMKNPSFKNTLSIPEPLQRIGNSIAGREVSPFKVYVALVLFIVASVLTVVLLTVGTRGGLTAIGRNPLSKQSVLRGLFQVISAGVLIFITSLIGVYLLLRL